MDEGERERERCTIPSSLGCIRFTGSEEATMLWKLVENVKYEDIYEVTLASIPCVACLVRKTRDCWHGCGRRRGAVEMSWSDPGGV